MRNSVSFYKHYRPETGLSSGWRKAAGVFVAGAVFGWISGAGIAGAESDFRAPGAPSPALARLFAPRHAPEGAFEVLVIQETLERARALLLAAATEGGAASRTVEPPVQELDPLQAFGKAGNYPRTTVARLYTGRRAKVVRMPVTRGGRTVAAVTLVSPYPDPTLSRLIEGTMVIVLRTSPLQLSSYPVIQLSSFPVSN
jgi:hypothetical protein